MPMTRQAWFEVKRLKITCPICGKPNWCCMTEDGSAAMCRREKFNPSNKFELIKQDTDARGETYWIYKLEGGNGAVQMPKGKPQKKLKPYTGNVDYLYHDKNGTLLFGVVRGTRADGEKYFFQVRPDGNGGWLTGTGATKNIKRVPYRIPEVVDAVKNGETVFITEGEKDVHSLTELDLQATTNPEGAGKWRPEFAEYFIGADVVVLADMDKKGYEHADQVAGLLQEKANSVKIIKEWSGLTYKEKRGPDVTDWLNNGGTKAELLQMVKIAGEADPGPPPPPQDEPKTEKKFRRRAANFTDLGNAERFVDRHGKDLRYCHPKGQWLVWDGQRWKPDDTAEVKRRAKDTVMSLYARAAKIRDDDARQKLIENACRCESNHKLKAMIELAESEEGIPVLPDQLDCNQWLLNVKNGTLDLKTGELRPHKRKNFITKLAPVEYDPEARSRLWEDFLEDVLPDPEVRSYVQRAAGYSMTGYLADERIFFAYGRPATGKGTFLSAVQSTLGDYACTSGFEAFLKKRATGGAKPEIAKLDGVRFVASNEVEDGRKLAEDLLNTLTGGDVFSTRFLYQRSEFEFLPVCKLWLAANNRPAVSSQRSAIWRRLDQVPFDEVIPEDERDPDVKENLRDTELSGPAILNWLVEGCREWQEQGLNPPPAVKNLTEEYRNEMDNLKGFFEDRCVIEPFARADNSQLWVEYKEWAEEAGIKFSLTQAKFGRELTERGYPKKKTGSLRYREGIGLMSDKKE